MKNHNKDAVFIAKRCIVFKKNMIVFLRMPEKQKARQDLGRAGFCKYYFYKLFILVHYFFNKSYCSCNIR